MSRFSRCAALALLLACVPGAASAQAVRGGLWKSRGFFDTMYAARIEAPVRTGELQNVFIGGEVSGASRDNVSLVALSLYAIVRHEVTPRTSLVVPYVAAGVGGHVLRNRVTIPDVRLLTKTDTSAKGHVWLGARLPGVDVLHPYVETRWTVPSDYIFDYVAIGVSF